MQELFDPADTPDLLAGLTSPDDAAVWKLDDDRALVLTARPRQAGEETIWRANRVRPV